MASSAPEPKEPKAILAANIAQGAADAGHTKLSDADLPRYAGAPPGKGLSKVHLINKGSLEIACELARKGVKPCVLNFANNEIAGGPTGLKGSTQEEVLMKRTTLGASLPKDLYPLDDVVDHHVRWEYKKMALVYSPSVHVVRTAAYEPLPPGDLAEISVISCAAIRTPRTTNGRYLADADRAVTQRKIEMILDTALREGHKLLIAGQWGTGAFSNPLEVCELWVAAAAARPLTVVFPIYSAEFRAKMQECLAPPGSAPQTPAGPGGPRRPVKASV